MTVSVGSLKESSDKSVELKISLHQRAQTEHSEEADDGMGENICISYIWLGVHIQNIERIITQQQKNK